MARTWQYLAMTLIAFVVFVGMWVFVGHMIGTGSGESFRQCIESGRDYRDLEGPQFECVKP